MYREGTCSNRQCTDRAWWGVKSMQFLERLSPSGHCPWWLSKHASSICAEHPIGDFRRCLLWVKRVWLAKRTRGRSRIILKNTRLHARERHVTLRLSTNQTSRRLFHTAESLHALWGSLIVGRICYIPVDSTMSCRPLLLNPAISVSHNHCPKTRPRVARHAIGKQQPLHGSIMQWLMIVIINKPRTCITRTICPSWLRNCNGAEPVTDYGLFRILNLEQITEDWKYSSVLGCKSYARRNTLNYDDE